MAKSMYAQQMGGLDIGALRQMFQRRTPQEREITELRLESLREREVPNLVTRLEAYATTEDLTTPNGIEKVTEKINLALKAGKFGNNIRVNDYVKNFISSLTQRGISQSQIYSNRKNLYTITNPSNINRWLTEASVMKDADKAREFLEKKVVDLAFERNKLSDYPGGSKLSPFLDNRFNASAERIDQALREFTGGKGLDTKAINRITKGTYAAQVQADFDLEMEVRKLEHANRFKSPTLKEEQYLKILSNIEDNINTYDDKLLFAVQKHNFLTSSDTIDPFGGGPSAEMQKSKKDLDEMIMFRDVRLIGKYAEQYQAAYNSYKELRKKYPDKMVSVDFDEIMNKKVHNELYKYVPPSVNGSNNNTGFQPFSPKNESNIINNMLKNRNITFTKDIFDSSGKVWKQKGESVSGLGNPSFNSWKISKDGIKRDSKDNLLSLNLEIPTADWPSTFNLRPDVYMRGSVSLSPDDFVIEDSPYAAGAGYKHTKEGVASYNIYNNKYELK